jgi:hypothetical protein
VYDTLVRGEGLVRERVMSREPTLVFENPDYYQAESIHKIHNLFISRASNKYRSEFSFLFKNNARTPNDDTSV